MGRNVIGSSFEAPAASSIIFDKNEILKNKYRILNDHNNGKKKMKNLDIKFFSELHRAKNICSHVL